MGALLLGAVVVALVGYAWWSYFQHLRRREEWVALERDLKRGRSEEGSDE